MAKIKNTTAYPTVAPAANDLIIGTDVSDNKKTVTFLVSSIGGGGGVPQDLNSVLGVGNTSALNIELNGNASALGSSISVIDIFPTTISAGGLGAVGTAGQVLSSTGTGIAWIPAPGTNQSWNDTLAVSPIATANPELTGTFTIRTNGGLSLEGNSTLSVKGTSVFYNIVTLSDGVDLKVSTQSQLGIEGVGGVYDYGTTGQFLSATATGLAWSSGTTITKPTLQEVVNAGNTLLNSSIIFTGTGGITLSGTNTITGQGVINFNGNGTPTASATQGRLIISQGAISLTGANSEIKLFGSSGTAGQALVSNGPFITPTWQTVAGSSANLQQILDNGNTATQNINLTGDINLDGGGLKLGSNGFIELNGNRGTLGQVLISGGPGGFPTWGTGGSGVTSIDVVDTTYLDMTVDSSIAAVPKLKTELITTGGISTGPGGLTTAFYDNNTTGTNYAVGSNLSTVATTGSGSGIVVNITNTTAGSVVLADLSFNSGGSGYAAGDLFQVIQAGSDNNLIIEVDGIATGTYYDQTGRFSTPKGADWDLAVTNAGNLITVTNSDGTNSSSFTLQGGGGAVFTNAGNNNIELTFSGSGTGTVQSISLTDSTGSAGTAITSSGTFTFAEQAATATYLRTTSAVTGTSIKLSTETPTIQVVATKGGTLLDKALTIQHSNGTTNHSFVLGTTAAPSVATAGQVLAFNSTGGGYMEWVAQAAGGNMTSWNIDGDTGGPGTVADGETVNIVGGNGISTVSTPGTRTITITNTGVSQVNGLGGSITLSGSANTTVGVKAVLTATITTAGAGYVANNYYPTTKVSSVIGTAAGVIVRVTSVSATGGITGVSIYGGGKDWTIGDIFSVNFGTSTATITVASVSAIGTITATTWRGLSGTDKTTSLGAAVKTLGVFETELEMYSSRLAELSTTTGTGLRFGNFVAQLNDDQQIYASGNVGIASETNFANIRIGDNNGFIAGVQNNIAMGTLALQGTALVGSTSSGNIGMGLSADQMNLTGDNNVTIGHNARNGVYSFANPATSTNNNSYCVTLGASAGDNAYGWYDIFVGHFAGSDAISSSNNPNGTDAMSRVAIGQFAMTGDNATLLQAHRYNQGTVAIGAYANRHPGTSVNTNQGRGVYVGYSAGAGSNLTAFQSANRSDYHVVVGAEAMMDGAGGRQGQIAIGFQASIGDLATNIDTYNTSTNGIAIGYQAEGAAAVYANITRSGIGNIAIGYQAAGVSGGVIQGSTISIGTSAMAEGTESVAIGRLSQAGGSGKIGAIAIGLQATASFDYSIALGRGATATDANQFVVGSSSYSAGTTTTETIASSDSTWTVKINGQDYKIPMLAV